MKKKFFALVGIFLALTLTAPANTSRTSGHSDVTPSSYVVIGAFSIKRNAVKFTSRANGYADQLKHNAMFGLNANRKLYYVYVLVTPDHEEAISEATRIRNETKFADAWVYSGSFDSGDKTAQNTNVDINPITRKPIKEVKKMDDIAPQEEVTAPVEQPVTEVKETAKETPANNYVSVSDTGTGSEKKFIFKLVRGTDNAEVGGDVDVIDEQKSRKLGTYKGNQQVNVLLPSSGSKKLGLIADVFGYRKSQREIDLNARMEDDITIDENHDIIVPFELVRLQKGDISIMYNVYFYKDAGIMRPESRYEVNSLLEMMKENPKYKIRIHGHTNGNAAGKIIEMGDGSKNFFSLTGTKEGVGSAKRLSEVRGEAIKGYLIDNGIDPTRMEVKAWGGKKPIHDKMSNRAQENVRVEIEILEN
jgi:outer membrane protein OmpA-like peptidoglycan-associated protein